MQDAYVELEATLVKQQELAKKEFDELQTLRAKPDSSGELKQLKERVARVLQAYRDVRKELEEERAKRVPPPRAAPVVSGLSQERITALIKLVHPDRHQNSESANELTKWLLSLRRK